MRARLRRERQRRAARRAAARPERVALLELPAERELPRLVAARELRMARERRRARATTAAPRARMLRSRPAPRRRHRRRAANRAGRPAAASTTRSSGSTPNVSPSTLSSRPSSTPASAPSTPKTLNCAPVPLGDHATNARLEVVLADRGRRQVRTQLRRRAEHVRDERVRVRPGPDAIGVRVRIRSRPRLDARDELIDAVAASLCDQIRAAAEPARVGRPVVDADGAAACAAVASR